MQEATPEELAAEDPFGGRGTFLRSELDSDGIVAELNRAFGGSVAAVAWPGLGAWVDGGAAGLSPAEVLAWWTER